MMKLRTQNVNKWIYEIKTWNGEWDYLFDKLSWILT